MSARRPACAPSLVCPDCGGTHPAPERFCPTCRLPLVHRPASGVEATVSQRREWARKIKPQLAEGQLVRVAGASNQAEGEFIQGLLLEEGVPSLLRRSAGFDVPDFLAAGPRDVLVPLAGASTAREVLLESWDPDLTDAPSGARPVAPARLLAGLLAALVIGALVMSLAMSIAH